MASVCQIPYRSDANAQGVDALRHTLHPLNQLHGGRGRRDTQLPTEGIDRDAKAVVVLDLPVEVGLRLLQLFGQSLVPLREN